MFKIDIDQEVHLELIHFSHAKDIFTLVEQNRELFRTWLDWVDGLGSIALYGVMMDVDVYAVFIDEYLRCN